MGFAVMCTSTQKVFMHSSEYLNVPTLPIRSKI